MSLNRLSPNCVRPLLVMCSILLLATPLWAEEPPNLESRLQQLEAEQQRLTHLLEESAAPAWPSSISLSGLIEVEATAAKRDDDDGHQSSASDLTLATAELAISAESDAGGASLTLLYEEGEDVTVDAAIISFTHAKWFADVGLQYLPFGNYSSRLISDPLTLELGETQATALQGGFTGDNLTLSLFLFNGAIDRSGDEDHLSQGGVALTLHPCEGVEIGASYLNRLAESGAELITAPTSREVAAASGYLNLAAGPFALTAELLGATRRFAASDLDTDGDGHGDKPLAWSLETAYLACERCELALRLEGSEALFGQPKHRYGAALTWFPLPQIHLAVEMLDSSFGPAFGDGESRQQQATAQLAYTF